MKFTDIPKFTRSPPYHVDMGLDYLLTWITEHEKDFDLQLNPDFQRGHVWTREQQIAYVEYLLRGGSSGREIYFNMPGWMNSFKGKFVCVDGLQRLTACLGFMNEEIPAFDYYFSEFEGRLRVTSVTLSIHINNLKTKKEVLTWYLEMNTGGTVHTNDELDRVRKMLNEV